MMRKNDVERAADVEALALELKAEVLKLKNALTKLELDLGLLQTGNSDGPFWDGENAYLFMRNCSGNFDHNRVLLENLEKCSEYVSTFSEK